MKIVKHRNLMGLFFAIFMMLPLIAIGVRCAYITFNKNAKDSYYGETINEEIDVPIDMVSQFKPNETYLYSGYQKITNVLVTEGGSYIYAKYLYLNGQTYENVRIGFYGEINSTLDVYLRYRSDNSLIQYGSTTNFPSFTFVYESNGITSNSWNELNHFYYQVTYNNYSFLDNAFTYSVHEITDNNLGQIDFFTFFANMFLDLNNPMTQTYVNFVNWYFNYMLLVSLAYLLFFVIMWFINYIRQILEKGNSLGHGGF